MTRVIRFGTHTFADTGVRVEDNFAVMRARESRLIGGDGSFDEDGENPSPRESGRVRFDCWLKGESPAEVAALRDTLRGLTALGARDLVIETDAGDQRSTRAKLIRVEMPEVYARMNRQHQYASLTWSAYPRWYSVEAPAASGSAQLCSGALTDFTRSHAGNIAAHPVITIAASTAITTLRVRRIVGGVTSDEIAYNGGLDASDILAIDTRRLRVTVNGEDAYREGFVALHPAWFRLMPGENTIRVVLGAGESASVTVNWLTTWV